MKTYIVHVTVAADKETKSFLTQVRESARDIYEAKCKALDGWPVGSFVTSAWEV